MTIIFFLHSRMLFNSYNVHNRNCFAACRIVPYTPRAMKHLKFISRTVLVRNDNVDEACRILNRIMGSEGFLDQYRRTMFYEKPTQMRRRINYEKCKAIYDEDMKRKINFVLRKNRPEPFPGCY